MGTMEIQSVQVVENPYFFLLTEITLMSRRKADNIRAS